MDCNINQLSLIPIALDFFHLFPLLQLHSWCWVRSSHDYKEPGLLFNNCEMDHVIKIVSSVWPHATLKSV